MTPRIPLVFRPWDVGLGLIPRLFCCQYLWVYNIIKIEQTRKAWTGKSNINFKNTYSLLPFCWSIYSEQRKSKTGHKKLSVSAYFWFFYFWFMLLLHAFYHSYSLGSSEIRFWSLIFLVRFHRDCVGFDLDTFFVVNFL